MSSKTDKLIRRALSLNPATPLDETTEDRVTKRVRVVDESGKTISEETRTMHVSGTRARSIRATRRALRRMDPKERARVLAEYREAVADTNATPQRMERPSAGATYAGGDGSGNLDHKGE